MFDTFQFLKDHSITLAPEGHEHCTEGNAQIDCPFCREHEKYHMGILYDTGYGNCWHCGGHNIVEIIKQLLNCSWAKAKSERDRYLSGAISPPRPPEVDPRPLTLSLPLGTKAMKNIHRQYLERRNFNNRYLESVFDIQGTGKLGKYGMRIIIPIYFQDKLVNFQGRDITDKHSKRYLFCRKENEVLNRKEILYNIDNANGRSVVVVEGPTDVWRLGHGAVATFGISYSVEQVKLLSKYDEVFIMYDSHDEAQKQAGKLADDLSLFVDYIEIINLVNVSDPGELKQSSANKIMRRLLG